MDLIAELDFCNARVAVAQRIIRDLKDSGQESVEALVKTINEYEGVEKKLTLVIEKEKKSLAKREKKAADKKKHLQELTEFVKMESGSQDEKIKAITLEIKDREKTIVDLNFDVVHLQAKLEAQHREIDGLTGLEHHLTTTKFQQNDALKDLKVKRGELKRQLDQCEQEEA